VTRPTPQRTRPNMVMTAVGTIVILAGIADGLHGRYDRGTYSLVVGWFALWLATREWMR
jgi:hypothetical protein